MNKVVRIKELFLLSIVVLLPLNIIDGLLKINGKQPYEWYHWILYTVPFIGLFFVILISRDLKIFSVIYGITSLLCIIFGDRGNITGAWFLYLFFYTWDNPRGLVFFGALACLVITGKFCVSQYTYFEYIKYIWGYYFIIGISLYLTLQKKLVIISDRMDDTDKRIIKDLLRGYDRRQIAVLSRTWPEQLTANAVTKRIEKIRKIYDSKTDAELVKKMIQCGALDGKTFTIKI